MSNEPRTLPKFNVSNFQGITNIQMNEPMRRLLVEFISEVEDDWQEMAREVHALRKALVTRNTVQSQRRQGSRPRY
jgi:hypothetical protein